MSAVKQMRDEIKNYIETADDKVVKMVHAMLEVNAIDEDLWDDMPDDIKLQFEESLQQAERGEVISHEEVKKKYPQWFSK